MNAPIRLQGLSQTGIARRLQVSERSLHGYTADLLRLAGVKDLIAFHPANEGQRSPRQGAFLKRMLMVPGVADFVVITPGGQSHMLELKGQGGRMSPEQVAFAALCERNGTDYALANTTNAVDACLKAWGAIK